MGGPWDRPADSTGRARIRPPASRVRWDDAQRKRSITSRADPAPATVSHVTGGTFTGHGARRSFGRLTNS
ncbi:hypothetical protein STVIR_7368 [Streptomyces viridochromogenes Tue57]|uniref:Uncharacterized protein n=1 Tax=Streptomyces viridochromogenes Tue57 TaxID=1160705 RepID=L8P6E8_STRVR|nr:hypothetical protein STVIR_7368 [Streptomyces viridochromogenes Tue57]